MLPPSRSCAPCAPRPVASAPPLPFVHAPPLCPYTYPPSFAAPLHSARGEWAGMRKGGREGKGGKGVGQRVPVHRWV